MESHRNPVLLVSFNLGDIFGMGAQKGRRYGNGAIFNGRALSSHSPQFSNSSD